MINNVVPKVGEKLALQSLRKHEKCRCVSVCPFKNAAVKDNYRYSCPTDRSFSLDILVSYLTRRQNNVSKRVNKGTVCTPIYIKNHCEVKLMTLIH